MTQRITITLNDQEGDFEKLIKYIQDNAEGGHTFDVIVDDGDLEQSFCIDGDGDFEILELKCEDYVGDIPKAIPAEVKQEAPKEKSNEDLAIEEAKALKLQMDDKEGWDPNVNMPSWAEDGIYSLIEDVIDFATKIKDTKEALKDIEDSAQSFYDSVDDVSRGVRDTIDRLED